MKGAYNEAHCWQYDIRLKNLARDLSDADLTAEEANGLRIRDFEFAFVPKDDRKTCAEIVRFIVRHEWLGKMPKRPTHRFVATYEGKLSGVIVMATPNSFSNLLGEENRHLEKLISRGACISWSPKNLGSALVMFAVRWTVKQTGFRFFTAYSDVEARELGTIYQACNFRYLGQNSGARFEYFDPNFPATGWFSDRQFRKTSQVKRYARELMIPWQDTWDDGDGLNWTRVPYDLAARLKAQAAGHERRCKKRRLLAKHKYAYVLGQDKRETDRLRELFTSLHPELQNIPYPKFRGPDPDTADKIKLRPVEKLTTNFEDVRPQKEAQNILSPYLTVKEIAQMMRVSDWTIYNIIKTDRTFPAVNIGLKKRFVIDRERLPIWLEKRTKNIFLKENFLPLPEEMFSKSKGGLSA